MDNCGVSERERDVRCSGGAGRGVCVSRWLPRPGSATSSTSSDLFSPYSVSVRGGRVLVTCRLGHQLLLYAGADGARIGRVRLARYAEPRHAVETVRRTFVVCHVGPLDNDNSQALVTAATTVIKGRQGRARNGRSDGMEPTSNARGRGGERGKGDG